MSNEYIVVHDENYGPEYIITTDDDLAEECEERGMEISNLATTPLNEWLAAGRRAYNYMYLNSDGTFKSAEELAAE